MKREKPDSNERKAEHKLDQALPGGGGGGVGPNPGYMETFDVIQAPHPKHGKPLPDEDEEQDY